MFKGNKRLDNSSQQLRAFLEQGCEFEGKLRFSGIVRLNGRIAGDIYSNDTLIVGESASIVGNIHVGTLIIAGKIAGDIIAKERVEIHPTAIVEGTIISPIVSIQEGAEFIGNLTVKKGQLIQNVNAQVLVENEAIYPAL